MADTEDLGPQALVYTSRLSAYTFLLLYSCAIRLHCLYTPSYVGVSHRRLNLCTPLLDWCVPKSSVSV